MIILKKLYLIITPVVVCALILYSSCIKYNDLSTSTNTSNTNAAPTIIIDAGHGGFDGGTSADDGTVEKDINLAISLYLFEYLNSFGFNTILTRDSDNSLEDDGLNTIRKKKVSDIHNRMEIMRDADNAVFVSIHQNHYSIEKYNGLQVFYSPNHSEESSLLAQSIQETVVQLLQPENDRQIKKCGTSVYLMYNAVKPAVLVECGFLSNYKESQLLKTQNYQKKIAFCIALGIQDYVNDKE